ncbi:MAG: thioredoxin family protein [Candidatus Riflebacteria bacterium]|nr:thioredoxin family protein [Candidatus Riflebacteria bacterium]
MNEILNTDKLEEIIKGNKIVLAFFHAGWCRPSERQLKILSAISDEYKGKVYFASIDADKADPVCEKYSVKTLPQVILFGEAEIIETLQGFQQEVYIREYLNYLLKQAEA